MNARSLCAVLSAVALTIVLVSCTSRSGGNIETKGNIIEIKTKDHEVKALKGATEEGTYVVMSARAITNPESLAYLDGRFSLLLREDYERFQKLRSNPTEESRKEYRDIRRRLRRVGLIAEDGPTQKKIQEIIRSKPIETHPVITITMTELQVMELRHKGKPVYLSGDLGKHYLVSKIKKVE
ncbi:MAG TPA: hypothetical protein PLW83_02840 [Deltaproteobacteria bacterium]|nr:hypothetical protein [Deltaproteobacteria bacterium]